MKVPQGSDECCEVRSLISYICPTLQAEALQPSEVCADPAIQDPAEDVNAPQSTEQTDTSLDASGI